jgi:hypothetical protein
MLTGDCDAIRCRESPDFRTLERERDLEVPDVIFKSFVATIGGSVARSFAPVSNIRRGDRRRSAAIGASETPVQKMIIA